MGELDIGWILVLWLWALGLGGIEIEIEGGHGWAERLPTWYYKRGRLGKVFGWVMGQRPLTGYHVFAFTIPMLLLHLPFVAGVDWTLEGELLAVGTYFALAVFWDYLWFVLNPAYTVQRFKRGNVWWFEVPWIWRFPLDYYTGVGLSFVLAALASWAAGDWPLRYITATTGTCVARAPTTARPPPPTGLRRPRRCGRAARPTYTRSISFVQAFASKRRTGRTWTLRHRDAN
jgi:hypothetical protein